MFVIATRIMKQVSHDKRSIALILITPIMVLTLFWLFLSNTNTTVEVAFVNVPEDIQNEIRDTDNIEVVEIPPSTTPEEFLKTGDVFAIIEFVDGQLNVFAYDYDALKLSTLQSSLQTGEATVSYLYGSSENTLFDSYGFLLLATLSFFLIFLLSGMSFVKERTSKTIDRLMLSPIKAYKIVLGYIIGFGFFASIQISIMLLFVKYILDIYIVGELWLMLLVMLLVSIIALQLGILVSSIAKSEFQVAQFIPIIVIPQVFFSGLIPVESLPKIMQYITHLMPLYYGCKGLENIMVYGFGFFQIVPQLIGLVIFIIILFIINVSIIKHHKVG